MKILFLTISATIAFFAFSSNCSGQVTLREETYTQKTVKKASHLLRSSLRGHFRKLADKRYVLTKSGQGHYSDHQDIQWTIKSETELRENLLCPLQTTFTIRGKKGQKLFICKNEYDYDKKTILVTSTDENGKIHKNFKFSLEIPTTDYATLVYFLKPFLKDMTAGKTIRFNFLSSEPGIYKLKAQLEAKEALGAGSQQIETIKIAIRPDMGAFNIILDRFVPPTLLWYSQESPHTWLKYEGLESGRGSAHITTTVKQMVPVSRNE